MSEPAFDLVVIGAGPAGSSLALRLARSGFAVALCDQHRIPRDKLCGEFLSADAVSHLGQLGLAGTLARALDPPRIARLRLTVPGERDLEQRLDPPALGLSRLGLDAALAASSAAAGVEVREQWRAARVRREEGLLVVEGVGSHGQPESLRARVVAGAFGKEERFPGEKPRPPMRPAPLGFIAWKAHHAGESPRDTVELHTFPGGYCGVAAIEGGRINVCALATRRSFLAAGSSLAELERQAARTNPALARCLLGLERADPVFLTAAGMRFGRREPVAGPILCVGDAAAMIAPLCGDGIGIALSSAALAGDWVARRLGGEIGHEAMLAGYARAWRRAFLRPLALGDVLQRLLLAPAGAAWTVRVCRALPALTGWLVHRTRAAAAST